MIRQMGGLKVLQRSEDGYFDGNALLQLWNKKNGGTKRRKMVEFLDSSKTVEFIESLIEDLQGRKNDLPDYQVIKKGKGATEKDGTKVAGSVWMHPYLFIDFAMWLNPAFKVQVLRFVYDELIKNRHEAGDMYKSLSSSGMKLRGYNFKEVATALQWLVFGTTGKNLRQTATQDQLKELSDTQTKLAFAINMGYIACYAQLLDEMRKMYFTKRKLIKQTA
jgi:hypothetical protein